MTLGRYTQLNSLAEEPWTLWKNYTVSRKEALALVFSLKRFRHCLLIAKKFTLFSYRQALHSAFDKKDGYGRVVRWPDLISEYCSDLIHRNSKAKTAGWLLFKAIYEFKYQVLTHFSNKWDSRPALLRRAGGYIQIFKVAWDPKRRVKNSSLC